MVNPYSLTGTSAAVNTAITPATDSALDVSIASMRACGWSLNTTLAWSTSWGTASAGNLALPVTLPAASTRVNERPTLIARTSP
jgi:hypothetical protein